MVVIDSEHLFRPAHCHVGTLEWPHLCPLRYIPVPRPCPSLGLIPLTLVAQGLWVRPWRGGLHLLRKAVGWRPAWDEHIQVELHTAVLRSMIHACDAFLAARVRER